MKKIAILLCFIAFAAINTNAQSVKIGVKAGMNYANLTGSEVKINTQSYNTEAITSYHAGLVAELKLIEKLAIQPELLYSTQGATYKNALKEFKNDLGYISIPVMAKIYLSKSISLELGPQASFLVSQKNEFDSKDAETFDFAAAGGLGWKLTEKIFLQARYTLGLSEASKEAKIKNSVVQLSAGVFF